MNFMIYNLTSSNVKMKISDSTDSQAAIIDTGTLNPSITPNSTFYTDKGVAGGCISGYKYDILMQTFNGNGVVGCNVADIGSYLRNTVNDTQFLSIELSQFISADLPAYTFRAFARFIFQLVLSNQNNIKIGDWAFGQTAIGRIINNGTGMLDIGEYAFGQCGLGGPLNLYNVLTIGEKAFFSNRITQLTLGPHLTTIGANAFAYNQLLTTVQIPAKVTAIPESCFQGCSGITTIDFTSLWDGSSQLQSIAKNAFDSCYSLTTIMCPWATPPTLDPEAFGGLVQMGGSGSYSSSSAYDGGSTLPFVIKVPSSAVSAYKAASGWSNVASAIQGV